MTTLEDVVQKALTSVEKTYVVPYQDRILQSLERTKSSNETFSIVVNSNVVLDFIRSQESYADSIINLLEKVDFWQSLHLGIKRYVLEDTSQMVKFNKMINYFEISFTDTDSEIEFVEEQKRIVMTLALHNSEHLTFTPELFFNTLHDTLDELAETQAEEEDSPEEDESITRKLDSLINCSTAKEVKTKDLSKLIRVVHSENFWQPSEEESKQIEECKQMIEQNTEHKGEQYIKSWVITKINKEGKHQRRLFLLSEKNIHTCRFKRQKVDSDRMHCYPIQLVEFMDVARFIGKETEPYGLCIWVKKDKEQVDFDPLSKSATSPRDQKKKKDKWVVKKAKNVLNKIGKEKRTNSINNDQPRPNSKDYKPLVFGAPTTVCRSDEQKEYLEEIAWCLFATISAHRAAHPLRVFYKYRIKAPKMLSLKTLRTVVKNI
ncbi:PDE4A [Acrasis kona]|uniref:PDE4A n=1 Tax=Acrasis kona TaxID=1008807 RepID=A0AAW2YIY8_9EUKA